MLDFLTFSLCTPYSETTDGKQFDMLLEKVAERGRSVRGIDQNSRQEGFIMFNNTLCSLKSRKRPWKRGRVSTEKRGEGWLKQEG